jgi:4-amino-4-deoxy-L-arabinose transferase-like glycosyltransferase
VPPWSTLSGVDAQVPEPGALANGRFGPWVAAGAALAGLAAAAWLSSHGLSNLYGDGIAHLNIARKVVDARDATLWDRYVQLGSPWLPVPHLAMLPFVWVDGLWRSGWAGTIPSLAAHAASAWLLYRIAFAAYASEAAAVAAAAAFALNPSVLYMAATPMTELPFVALLLATSALVARWDGRSRARLAAAAGVAAALALTRYEGWAVVPAGALVAAAVSRRPWRGRAADAGLWLAVAATGPLAWLWHNWAIYGDPLEFVRGPYSARGVFAAQASRLGWADFVVGNPAAALGWALLTVAVVAGPLTVALATAGLAVRFARRRRVVAADAPFALMLASLAFLVFSLFRGEAQIYPLAALALLNVRYGVPYVAAAALLVPALGRSRRSLAVVAAVVALQYAALAHEGFAQLAVCQEPLRNSRNARPWRDRERLAAWLAANPPDGLVLMHSGELGPVVPASGLTFDRIVHEGTREWHAWAATGELPGELRTAVVRDGDEVSARLAGRADFTRAFATDGTPRYEVWVRGQGSGVGGQGTEARALSPTPDS